MIDNKFSRAVTNTQAAATAAVAAFNASTLPAQRIGHESSLTITSRARVVALATTVAEQQGLSEQRHSNYRFWVQSADGQKYCDWAPRASLLSQAIAARNEAVVAAWRFEASTVISPADRAAGNSSAMLLRSKRARSVRRIGVALMLASPVVWVLAYFLVLLTGGRMSTQAILPIAWLVLGSALVVIGVRMAGPSCRGGIDNSIESTKRIELLGFDPLSEPQRLPRAWTDDSHVGERLDKFMTDAYTNFPQMSEFPPLELPEVRTSKTEPSSQVRALLDQFAAADTAGRLRKT